MWIDPTKLKVGDIFKCEATCDEMHFVTKVQDNIVYGTYGTLTNANLFNLNYKLPFDKVFLLTTKLSNLFYGENN